MAGTVPASPVSAPVLRPTGRIPASLRRSRRGRERCAPAPSSLCELANAGDGSALRDRPGVFEDGEAAAVPIGDVDEVRVRIDEDLTRVAVERGVPLRPGVRGPRAEVLRRDEAADLLRLVGIRGGAGAHALPVPRLEHEAAAAIT